MNQTSDVSVYGESEIEDGEYWERSRIQTKNPYRRGYRVISSLRGSASIDNSSIRGDLSQRYGSNTFENSTNPDFEAYAGLRTSTMNRDDNVLRIPIIARKRVKVGKVKRLSPLDSK